MMTIFTTTHRQSCLEFAQAGEADVQAYDTTIGRYYQELQTQATEDGYELEIVDGESLYTYWATSSRGARVVPGYHAVLGMVPGREH